MIYLLEDRKHIYFVVDKVVGLLLKVVDGYLHAATFVRIKGVSNVDSRINDKNSDQE